MRLLLLGDRIVSGTSAYTKIGRETCTRLAEMGHSVAHIPMGYANRMGRQMHGKILIYPSGNTAFGEDVAQEHYLDFRADMLITVKTPWVFNKIYMQALNFVPFAIIDHSPVSSAITSRIRTAFKVIAVSRFGQRELRKHNIKSTYIPHGVDTNVYRPLGDKEEYRKLWFMEPDSFVVGIVARNQARKMISRQLRGYKRFLELNPNVHSHLFLWTAVTPQRLPSYLEMGVADVGVSLIPEIVRLGLGSPPNDVRWFNPEDWRKWEKIGGLPEWDERGGWDMVKLYNAMDVNMECTGGEAAGITKIEAAACGTPSICTDYAGAPEYLGAGYTVPANDYTVISTPGTRFALADIDKMAEALTKIYNTDREKLARRARRFSLRFDWKRVMQDYWKPFLEECEEELYPHLSKGGLSSWANERHGG